MPKIANILFSQEFFDEYIKTIFGESFAHSSLSFEKSFEESKYFATKLKDFISPKNTEYARQLEQSENPLDQDLLKQRLAEARASLIYYGIPEKEVLAKNELLHKLLKVRKYFAYGIQNDYFNDRRK